MVVGALLLSPAVGAGDEYARQARGEVLGLRAGESRTLSGDRLPAPEPASKALRGGNAQVSSAIRAFRESPGGRDVDLGSIEVFDLPTISSAVAAPAGTRLRQVELKHEGDSISANLEVAATAEGADVDESGEASGSPYWRLQSSGQYTLSVKDRGTALFLFKREQLVNDGSSAYNYFGYARKAVAVPKDRPYSYDAKVADLAVGNYPTAATKSGLSSWLDFEPATDFEGNCNSSGLNVNVDTPIAGVSYSFIDCDKYDVRRHLYVPGEYKIVMDQGSTINGGERQAAYAVAWKSRSGYNSYQYDTNYVRWYLMGDTTECSSTDASRTCTP